MKRVVFFFSLLIAMLSTMSGPVSAQSLSPMYNTIKQTANAIPPESFSAATMDRFKSETVYPDIVLTYFEGSYTTSSGIINKNYFICNDGATNIQMFPLPDGLHVMDFEHLPGTDYVVFCGYAYEPSAPYHSIGMFGWFDLSSATQSPYTPDFHYVKERDFVQVERIVPYMENGNHIAAIGKKRVSSGWNYSLIYSQIVIPITSSSISYYIYNVRSSEAPVDIIKTENYLVFVGTDCSQSSNTMFIRKATYSDYSSQAFAELNDVYCFTETDGEYAMPWYGTYLGNEITPSGNLIAVGGPMNLYSGQIVSRIRVFDVIPMVNVNSQQIVTAGKMGISDMAYTHSSGLLATLMGGDPLTGGLPNVALLLKPTATAAYTTDGIYDNDGTQYSSLDNLNYSPNDCVHFVMAGFAPLGVKWLLKNSTHPAPINGCNDVKNYSIDIVSPIIPQYSADPITNSQKNDYLITQSSNTIFLQSKSICTD